MMPLRKLIVLTIAFTLLAFFTAEIPHPYNTDASEINVRNIMNSGHTNQYQNGSLLLVDFNDGKRALYFKECSVCSLMWQQIGAAWNKTGGIPPNSVCDTDSSIPGCKPTLAWYFETFQGCPPGCGHSPYVVTWDALNASSYEAQIRYYTSWYPLYGGSIGEVLAATGTQYPEDIRVRAVNNYGASEWGYVTLHVQCSEYQDPW